VSHPHQDRLNVVLVLVDSLNKNALSIYNDAVGHTPNVERLALRGVVFDDAMIGSLPCMPARRDIFTGRKEFLWRPWGPLEYWDPRLPRLMKESGYATAIVTDHYHYWEEHGNGYLQCFDSAELIRGQELDFWQPPAVDDPLPGWVEQIERWRPEWGRRYYGNARDFRHEADFFSAKVMAGSARWLERFSKSHAPFFLHVEAFEPHEPWQVPNSFAARFGSASDDDRFTIWPPYQSPITQEFLDQLSEQELHHIRLRYTAKVAYVDQCLGTLVDTLERLRLLETTVIILTTDHGHDLGWKGVFGKSHPHYDSHANIPLVICHPESAHHGERTRALTSTVDLFSTILAVGGVAPPELTQSRDLAPIALEPSTPGREHTVYGTFGQGICITDGTWTLIKNPRREGPLYAYSSYIYKSMTVPEVLAPAEHGQFVPGVDLPQWKTPVREAAPACLGATPPTLEELGSDLLFRRDVDPEQTVNLITTEAGARDRLLRLLRETMTSEGSPPEQFPRLGL
jgi:arylsulfatase A-like enzyme